ncbi:hypothetical protein T492DRAFT_1056130 [Pavlovales sp. CCMP2436]|nr:hypothetical protein T492DRAFT_1056130 [Pavlovales sp. CCMP2436]|mmetsp:Transcript_11240/g.28395  ORF Transcript_11240/g.28395 Transcript_11240/m.28395 type:complete len:156 (-) Transcript_11240:100-567(-)
MAPPSSSAAGRKLAIEAEEERVSLREETRALREEASQRDGLLAVQTSSHAALGAEAAGLRKSVGALRGAVAARDAQIAALQHDLKEERRVSARYLHEIATSEKMLSTICAYRTSDDMRDRLALLQENGDLEEQVVRLKAQLRRLAVESVVAMDDD